MNNTAGLLVNYIKINSSSISFSNAGDKIDSIVTTEKLIWHLNNEHPFSRREFCNFLGIRESTLSGWIKENRVPRMAKVAFGLLLAQNQLKGQLKKQNNLMKNPIPIKKKEEWLLIQLDRHESGDITGSVIAEGIPDINNAMRLSQGNEALDLAGQAIFELSEYQNEDHWESIKSLKDKHQRLEERTNDYESWQETQKVKF